MLARKPFSCNDLELFGCDSINGAGRRLLKREMVEEWPHISDKSLKFLRQVEVTSLIPVRTLALRRDPSSTPWSKTKVGVVVFFPESF